MTTLNDESSTSGTPHRLLFRASILVQKHFSKKNAKVVGFKRGGSSHFAQRTGYTPFIRSKSEAAMAERFLVSCLSNGERIVGASYPISVPMLAVFKFKLDTFYTQKGEVSIKAGDLSNIIQGVEDALQRAGIIRDDALITKIIANKEFGLENEVIVELFTDEDACSRPHKKEERKRKPRS